MTGMGEQCSVCGVAVTGASILYTPDGRIVCPACFSKVPMPVDVGKPQWKIFAAAGGVAGVIPFAVHMSSSSSTTVNGHVTSFVYRDWVAVVCGVVAIMLGIIATAAARKEQLQRGLAFAAGIGVVLLGGVQIARGFGVFETPGSGGDSSSSMTFETTTPARTTPAVDEPAKPKGDPNSPDTCEDQDCFDLGIKLEKTDPAGSLKAWVRACGFGATGGCFNAGFDYTHQQPPDNENALKYFKIACDNDHAGACNEIGRIAATSEPPDFAVAKEMFEKSCTLDDAQACANLGILYNNGHGVDKDPKRARELYEKGCDGGISDGCFNLALMREKGQGGKKDKAGAKAAYQLSCDAGDPDACKAVKRLK